MAETTTYRLQSSPLVHAPGIVRWAQNGYAFDADRPFLRKLIAETWRGVPADAAHALLSGEAPFEVQDESVVFSA